MGNRWVLTVFDEDSGTESNIDFMAESKGEAGHIATQLFEAFPAYYGHDGYWEPVGFRRLNTKQYWRLPSPFRTMPAVDQDTLGEILQQKPKYFSDW